ncbi:hypothetical protein GOODEAATRI_003897 [Goodea atripinnis]|uniref:Uncharacterized protein n=1 Tax=Goodea atripinnis TaxID=208336 RepID=A0ABV0MEY1_9TELE
MRSVLYVTRFLETAGNGKFFKSGEMAASDLLGCANEEHFPLSHCTAGVPHTDEVGHYAINGALIKGHQQSLCDVILLKHPQEVQSLLGILQQLRGVSTPGQFLLDVDSQEAEVSHFGWSSRKASF